MDEDQQKGGGSNLPDKEQSRELARQFMKELGLGKNDLATLQKMDWNMLNAAGNATAAHALTPYGRTIRRKGLSVAGAATSAPARNPASPCALANVRPTTRLGSRSRTGSPRAAP